MEAGVTEGVTEGMYVLLSHVHIFSNHRRRGTSCAPRAPRLTSLSHGGSCGCKIAPGVLSQILKNTSARASHWELASFGLHSRKKRLT